MWYSFGPNSNIIAFGTKISCFTFWGDNSHMPPPGRHFSDGEPLVVPEIVALNRPERIAWRASTANAEQDACKPNGISDTSQDEEIDNKWKKNTKRI